MHPALSTPFAQPPIPVIGQLSEKPRLGFTSKNPALHLRQSVCNSTTALGFEAALHLNRVRSRCSAEQYDPDLGLYYLRARYYNPGTGRFLLRDPENGKAVDPASLHKYLYAGGDPVNAIDPTGLETAVEFVKATFISSLETIEWATQTASRVRCLISVSITLLNAITNHTNWRWPLTWAGILNSAWGCKNAFTPL